MDLPWTPEMQTKVDEFKKLFAANPRIVTSGQFQVMHAISEDFDSIIGSELRRLPLGALRPDVRNLIDRILYLNATERETLSKLLIELKYDTPGILELLKPDPKSAERVRQAYNSVWLTGGMPPPLSFPKPSLAAFVEAQRIERDKCADSARYLTSKMTTALGASLTPARRAGIRPSGALAHATLDPSSTRGGGTIVKYNPTELARAVEQMVSAISSGYMFVVGVMSGSDTKKGLNPEHWLVVFAFVEKGIFLFWDGDASTTELMDGRNWGPGIGMLFWADDHLSTGIDDFDLRKLGADRNYHADAPTRHRYQVLQAFPYPN